MGHKAGFVNIIGNPNVGKSTLMNGLVGEKLSIITPKAQTTRHRILGIVNDENFQIVFSDTPGIVNPHYKLHESMMSEVKTALIDADILLYIVEFGEKELNEIVANPITESEIPIILVINKIDKGLQKDVAETIEYWKNIIPRAEIVPASALHKFNVDFVLKRIVELLPEHPAFYPKDELTDRSERFFVSEMIREKILQYYKKEIPYSVEVIVDSFKEEEKIVRISAFIYVARESQRIILIGKGGNAIKWVGTKARIDMEEFLQKKVFLELSVKVDKDWRNNENSLKKFGYQF